MTIVYNFIYIMPQYINYKPSTFYVVKARQFNIDNWVLDDRWNLQVQAGNNKLLTHKWLGPYKVTKAIGSYTYWLEVPKDRP